MPAILDTWEAEIERIEDLSSNLKTQIQTPTLIREGARGKRRRRKKER